MPRDELPKGVGAKHVSGDGRELFVLDPFLDNNRWPNLSADSSHFKSLAMPERLYLLSEAFIEAAIALCEGAGQKGAALDWPTASVCLYCKYLGSELFLKACITRLDKGMPTHDLAKLRARYHELLPDPQYDFPVSLIFRPRDVDGLAGIELDGIDLKPDEILRYGGDREGNSSSLTHMFVPGYQLNVLRDLQERSLRIWASLPAAESR